MLTSGQFQLEGLQQQQLQQIYLQQQQQAQHQQQQGSTEQTNATVSMENTTAIPATTMSNHVPLQGIEGENHEHVGLSQLSQASVPGPSSQNNWSDMVQPHNGQNLALTDSDSQFAKPAQSDTQSSTACTTAQGTSDSVAPMLITRSLTGPFSQSEPLLTDVHSNSSVSAMETSIAPADHIIQVTSHQNSIAGPDTVMLSSLPANFVSTSSNVLLSQSVVSSQGTTFLSSESLTTGSSTTTTEPSLTSGMDTTLLGEINCSADIKPSPLTGNSDPTLSNGPISTYSGFSSSTGCASGMTISPFSSPSYVMSPTQKSPFHATSTLSPSLTQPLSIINPGCLSPSSGLQGGQSTFSPTLIPADLLSPSKQLAVVSPASSKSPFNLSSGGDNLVVPKLNLLFDPNAIPHPPPTPTPPLPTDKLSPQTPIIYVSTASASHRKYFIGKNADDLLIKVAQYSFQYFLLYRLMPTIATMQPNPNAIPNLVT